MNVFKALARDWLPPVLARWFRKMRGGGIRFEGDFDTWEEASSRCTGYDAVEILAKVLASTLKVKHGEAAAERDSVLFDQIEYAWPVLAGLMYAAARSGGRLNVLDFGGALGSSYFQNLKFLQTLKDVRWNVVEQPHYVDSGRKHIQGGQLRFYKSVEECLSENQPNVILLSSVLQYLPDPGSILLDLKRVGSDTIVFDRTIVNHSTFDRVYVQHVPASIYSASYPCRSFSESALLAALGKSYLALCEFPSLNFPALNAIESEFKGYIFTRRD
jgi:putative methyltransferase (TIGR04325 family)